ncbi:DUF2147 domain-containing protein [Albirhodobacter sp. R86504]|jgi:uncharacterized protein (DUF2147 family)|uniref:DUF2147 domain-containing protein n=1 Tax=Albirhodobacter sp. R86504 TaxID=3093848 RepID=UPI00366D8BEE
MKTLILGGAFALIAGIAHADPIEGTWKTRTDDNGNFGHVQVVPCGKGYCGTLVRSFGGDGQELASSPNKGKMLISDTRSTGGSNYEGKIYSPDRDKTYNSKLSLSGDKLKVSGCVMGICRDGGTWTRVK